MVNFVTNYFYNIQFKVNQISNKLHTDTTTIYLGHVSLITLNYGWAVQRLLASVSLLASSDDRAG